MRRAMKVTGPIFFSTFEFYILFAWRKFKIEHPSRRVELIFADATPRCLEIFGFRPSHVSTKHDHVSLPVATFLSPRDPELCPWIPNFSGSQPFQRGSQPLTGTVTVRLCDPCVPVCARAPRVCPVCPGSPGVFLPSCVSRLPPMSFYRYCTSNVSLDDSTWTV